MMIFVVGFYSFSGKGACPCNAPKKDEYATRARDGKKEELEREKTLAFWKCFAKTSLLVLCDELCNKGGNVNYKFSTMFLLFHLSYKLISYSLM